MIIFRTTITLFFYQRIGTVDAIREWFRTNNIPDGKPETKFDLEDRCMNADYAMKIIDDTE